MIESILKNINLPVINEPLSEHIKNINEDNNNIELTLGFPHNSYKDEIINVINAAAKEDINITLKQDISAHKVQSNLSGIKGVKNIIAVASGKGGVGKSTSAVNLALALKKLGANVGILDADIYGPNQPQMLGINEHPDATEDKKLKPLTAHGLQAMSIGFLIKSSDTPMVWRGPMVSGALMQLLNDTQWQDVDYLIIDLPPGTGDIQLTLAQKIPVTASVIITTPQDIALLDVSKAMRMFEKVNIPVMGIIENMSAHTCSQCGHSEAIFGAGGADKIAKKFNSKVLGHLPLDLSIRKFTDNGKPSVAAEPESKISQIYQSIAFKIAVELATMSKNYMRNFPKIEIEK